MPVADPRPVDRRGAGPLFALLALLAVVLLGVLAARSTETWIPSDPDTMRRLLELRQRERDLVHGWEHAQRGDTRFEYDTEIRFVTGRIDELEALAGRPRRVHGLAPWDGLLPELAPAAAIAVEIAAETSATLLLGFAAVAGLRRLGGLSRRVALAALLAPLAVPTPLFAAAAVRLAAGVGIAPSALLADVVEVLACLPFAVAILHVSTPRIDGRRIDAARDLGLGPATIFRRITLPSLAPAIVFAGLLIQARLVGDLSIARLAGVDDTPHRFAVWLRHHVVATVDFPSSAAGSLVALLAGLGLAGLAVVGLGRVRAPAEPMPPRRTKRRSAGFAAALPFLAPLAVVVALALPAAATDGAAAADRLAALVCEWGLAGLAAALGLALAVALALAAGGARDRDRAVAVVFALAALPTPAVAFALRLASQDLGLAPGFWLLVPALALVAAAPPAALLLSAEPDGEAAAGRHGDAVGGFRLRFAALLPLAAVFAFATALTAVDAATILGTFDRTALFRPLAIEETDLAGPLAAGLAVAFGLLAASALESARGGERPAA